MTCVAASYLDRIEHDGYAICSGVAPESLVDDLAPILDEAANRYGRHGFRDLLKKVPDVRNLVESRAVRVLAEDVLGTNAFVVRALYFDKAEGSNWAVSWHQDLTIAVNKRLDLVGFRGWSTKDGVQHVQPPDRILAGMLTVRIHLDVATNSNGALTVVPGSHNGGRLSPTEVDRFLKGSSATLCEVEKGGALVMRPLLLHSSRKATKLGHRRVIHLDFASKPLPAGLEWYEVTAEQ